MKHALWRELAESGFARLAATIWLLPLLQLLLRVQLNILGRQLFVESNLLEPRYFAMSKRMLPCSEHAHGLRILSSFRGHPQGLERHVHKSCRETALNTAMLRRGTPGSWKAARLSTRADQLVRVGKGAQEQFLEYAHYLPERSVQAAVDRQKLAGFAVLENTELAQDMGVEQVHAGTSAPAASCMEECWIVAPHTFPS